MPVSKGPSSKQTPSNAKKPGGTPKKNVAGGAKGKGGLSKDTSAKAKKPLRPVKPIAAAGNTIPFANPLTAKTIPPAASDKAEKPEKKGKKVDINDAENTDLHQGGLVRAVAKRADVRRGLARDVVVATLEELGQAIRAGREIKLPGLGRVKYQRTKETADTVVTIAKIRQSKTVTPGKPSKPKASKVVDEDDDSDD